MRSIFSAVRIKPEELTSKRAQGMPSSMIALMIIMVVVVAVSAIFVFSGIKTGASQTNQTTQISSKSEESASSGIDQMLAEQYCNPKCFIAQQAAKGYATREKYCSGTNAPVKNSGFCDKYNCVDVFAKKDPQETCDLIFNAGGEPPQPPSTLTCLGGVGGTPQC
jgi:hypothetical protein